MAAYVICDVHVTDLEAYERYKALAAAAVERHGGRYVVRGGRSVVLEGDREPGRLVVLEFPSLDDAKRWYASPEYAEAKAARDGAATGSFVAVDGV